MQISNPGSDNVSASNDTKRDLVDQVKRASKQLLEDAVTRKRIDVYASSSVTHLCAAVEACLSNGLRKRALGLFRSASTAALIHKLSNSNEDAARVSRMLAQLQGGVTMTAGGSSSSTGSSVDSAVGGVVSTTNASTSSSRPMPKYAWIRIALAERLLAPIVTHVADNAAKFYDRDAFMADPEYGSLLGTMLVGACALDYSRNFGDDMIVVHEPTASELVQRQRVTVQRIRSEPSRQLNFRGVASAMRSADDVDAGIGNMEQVGGVVGCLHQNTKAVLLFGKNNVIVQQPNVDQPMAGYLSLHQTAQHLLIHWTPNQLMNGNELEEEAIRICWNNTLQICLSDIVYVHCHQQDNADDGEGGGSVILVAQDGVQHPPIRFPKGGHMMAFLHCLETGLLPRGCLDPPLWSHSHFQRRRRPLSVLMRSHQPRDFVFRIVDNNVRRAILQKQRAMLMDTNYGQQPSKKRVLESFGSSSTTSSDSGNRSLETGISQEVSAARCSTPPIVAVCESMRKQIISRAFYGWLAHCRHMSTVRAHLSGLVFGHAVADESATQGITVDAWQRLNVNGIVTDQNEIYRLVYWGGVTHEMRPTVWPYLLGHYKFGSKPDERDALDRESKQAYETTMSEWLAVEAIVRQRDREMQAKALVRMTGTLSADSSHNDDVFGSVESDDEDSSEIASEKQTNETEGAKVIVTNASLDSGISSDATTSTPSIGALGTIDEHCISDNCGDPHGLISPACVSPASSNGGIYSQELLELFGLNLHRIEKDVQRCDRNYVYFKERPENLDLLRNVMCSYVWEHLDIGYMQGMCDLVAPLLVVFNDESLTFSCFCHLMERMVDNFPSGPSMDTHFSNMRNLIQLLDVELYEIMQSNGDYTHFYFCYRWFLLNFKREFCYSDIFLAWETIWVAHWVSSHHFVLFMALAMLEKYRDVIVNERMDFTDIIKFFNEMAEQHCAAEILQLARGQVTKLQTLLENK